MTDLPPEQRARQQIDAQLAASGWVLQDYKQFNPGAGRGIALREVPLRSGTCDNLLLVGWAAVGVVEAKKVGNLLSGVQGPCIPPSYIATIQNSKHSEVNGHA